MCGVFSIVFPTGIDPDQFATVRALSNALIVLSSERGQDSSGLAVVDLDGSSMRYRVCEAGYSQPGSEGWDAALNQLRATTFTVLGHTRRKSVGKVSTANAMPHAFTADNGTLCGVHNGTIHNHAFFGPQQCYENDSANLFWALAALSDPKDIITCLKKIIGSYALIWTKGSTCYFAKSHCGSIFRVWCPSLGAMVLASTEHILHAALAFTGLESDPVQRVFSSTLYAIGPTEAVQYDFYPAVKTDSTGNSHSISRWCEACGAWGEGSRDTLIYDTFICTACFMDRFHGTWREAEEWVIQLSWRDHASSMR